MEQHCSPGRGKGYKSSNDEQRVEDMWLEGEESQAHVGEDEVLCQEVQQLKQLTGEETEQIHWNQTGWTVKRCIRVTLDVRQHWWLFLINFAFFHFADQMTHECKM